ncbi:MAG: 50S ribosomal protein L25 [Pyrinomonadaceae bacterium]
MAEKQEIIVQAELRAGRGKNDSRRVRAAGGVPLVIYGGDGGSVSAVAPLRDLAAILRSESSYNSIFTLEIAGQGPTEVMFLDRQLDPIRGRLIHADLRRLVSGEKIEMRLPIHFTGTAVGMKTEGAFMDQVIHDVQVLCDPRKAPDFIEVDVTSLEVGESLHLSDISVPEGLEFLDEPETLVASVGMLREEPEEEAVTEEASAEPEVIGKGKPDDAE